MKNNIRSKGLELLLIPLFALMTNSCKDEDSSKSMLINTVDDIKYNIHIDTNNRIIAKKMFTSVGGSLPRVFFSNQHYEIIDYNGDGVADTTIENSKYIINPITKIAEPSDSTAKVEYNQKIYPIIKPLLFKK